MWSYPRQVDKNKKTPICCDRFSVFHQGTIVSFLLQTLVVIKLAFFYALSAVHTHKLDG